MHRYSVLVNGRSAQCKSLLHACTLAEQDRSVATGRGLSENNATARQCSRATLLTCGNLARSPTGPSARRAGVGSRACRGGARQRIGIAYCRPPFFH
jgi:hypothetical protein